MTVLPCRRDVLNTDISCLVVVVVENKREVGKEKRIPDPKRKRVVRFRQLTAADLPLSRADRRTWRLVR